MLRFVNNFIFSFIPRVILAVEFFLLGLLFCISIIGIPFGKHAFLYAGNALSSDSPQTASRFSAHPIANSIWRVILAIQCLSLCFSLFRPFISFFRMSDMGYSFGMFLASLIAFLIELGILGLIANFFLTSEGNGFFKALLTPFDR